MPKPDELLFPKEETPIAQGPARVADLVQNERWKVLIVDDEEEIHHVTKLVMGGFSYNGKKLQFLSAYTGEEARRLVVENPDTAVILLDVVMEEYDSGLKVVRYIRNELKNKFVRIILRTGQPGQAPEEKVIFEYDINDYKEKTEITAQKLLTVMVSALRTYNDMLTIEANRQGLEKIIEAAADIFQITSMEKFTSGVLTQLVSILNLKRDAIYGQASSFAATGEDTSFVIRAASGKYEQSIGRRVDEVLDQETRQCIEEAVREKKSHVIRNKSHVGFFESKTGSKSIICFEEHRALTELDRKLIEIFFANVSIGFDNIYLNLKAEEKALLAEMAQRQVERASREVVRQIAQRVESLQKISRAVAHQLRNPTTIIAGFANLLLNRPEFKAKHLEHLEGIVAAATRIEKITAAVIEYNSIRLGETRTTFLPDFAAEARAGAERKAAELSKAVDWTVEVEPLRVRMDVPLMAQALSEILTNSIEAFAGQRGTIGLRAGRRKDCLFFEVRDNGRGIPENELNFVHDPFYTTKPVGIGMGMARVDRIVEEHNGSLDIHSRPGEGTTVEILIPLFENRACTIETEG